MVATKPSMKEKIRIFFRKQTSLEEIPFGKTSPEEALQAEDTLLCILKFKK